MAKRKILTQYIAKLRIKLFGGLKYVPTKLNFARNSQVLLETGDKFLIL